MGFRFRRSIRVAPGIKLNLSKSGISTSIGRPGATLNLGSKGTRATIGLPGTGLSYSTKMQAERSSDGRDSGARKSGGAARGCGWLLLIILMLLLLGQCFRSSDRAGPSPSPSNTLAPPASASSAPVANHFVGDAKSAPGRIGPVYINSASANARSAPSASAGRVRRLTRGTKLTVIERKGDWTHVAADTASFWVATKQLTDRAPAPALQSRLKPKKNPRSPVFSGGCPCGSGHVCVGPRGGRYCITSGGNKRYGV